jgi:putative flippase GtrA
MPPGRLEIVGEWLRHHVGAVVATGADFIVMIVGVELLHFSPVAGTVAGGLCGAITNFCLARYWVFPSSELEVSIQLFRYALVAGVSLGLSAAGEHLLVNRAGLGYVFARILVVVMVSNLWNFPLRKFFVFRK